MNSQPFPRSGRRDLARPLLIIMTALTLMITAALSGAAPTASVYLPVAVGSRVFGVEPVGRGFYVATAITHAGDERLFVVERGGRIQILHADGRETTFLNLAAQVVSSPGEFGLFDLAFHPGYADRDSPGHGFFYVSYSGRDEAQIYTYISRFHVSADPDVADPTGETWLLKVPQYQIYHKGGELDFDPRSHELYVGLGEDTHPPNAQLLTTPKGKIIRMAVDDVPAGAAGDATGLVTPALVALGLRNPWRFDFDPASGRLYVGDVGENTWEEVNVFAPGDPPPNFGWPCREGPDAYALFQTHPNCLGNPTFTPPVVWLAHADGHCAVIGGKVIRPAHARPQFIYSDACSHQIFSLMQVDGVWQSTRLGDLALPGLITTIGEDVDGNLYLGNTASNGPIYRLILQ
ncbi:MAG: PQQ-dependent sugar dehydrogenase [Candidatus Promineofilum sp.]|nr:PQQ-dependent sugar dehydrogenase [Promineifilum sp.]